MKKSEVRNLKPGTPLVAFNSEDSNGVKCIFVRPEHGGEVALVECAHLGHRASVYRKQIRLAETGAADPHASLRAQYEKDAKWHPRPWELWEWEARVGAFENIRAEWKTFGAMPDFSGAHNYRRKPLIINGIELKDEPVREFPKRGDGIYIASPSMQEGYYYEVWCHGASQLEAFRLGLVHLIRDSAAAHGRALASFTEVPK